MFVEGLCVWSNCVQAHKLNEPIAAAGVVASDGHAWQSPYKLDLQNEHSMLSAPGSRCLFSSHAIHVVEPAGAYSSILQGLHC